MVDDEVDAARLQRLEGSGVGELRRVRATGLVVLEVMIVERRPDDVHRLGRGNLAGADRHRHDIGVARGIVRDHRRWPAEHGVDTAIGANRAAQDTGEIAAAGRQLRHLVPRLERGEGDQLRRQPVGIAVPVRRRALRIGQRRRHQRLRGRRGAGCGDSVGAAAEHQQCSKRDEQRLGHGWFLPVVPRPEPALVWPRALGTDENSLPPARPERKCGVAVSPGWWRGWRSAPARYRPCAGASPLPAPGRHHRPASRRAARGGG